MPVKGAARIRSLAGHPNEKCADDTAVFAPARIPSSMIAAMRI